MKSSFAARRKARVVGQDAPDDPSGDGPPAADSGDEQESTPIVKRPPSQKSSLRLSFNPSSTPTTSPDIPNPSEIFIPRKSALSRRAIEKNALRKSLPPQPSSHLPLRPPDDNRPSYTASALHELRNSTPSTPQNPRSPSPTDPSASRTLDIFSKFGSDLSGPPPQTAIPTEAEIREKKARRARLAHEQNYISLLPPPNSTISLLPPKSHPTSRLARSSSSSSLEPPNSDRLPLSAHASRSQRRRRTLQIRDLIRAAEHPSDSDSASASSSETARHAAYESSQTRFGTASALPRPQPQSRRRPHTPPRITPLPHLSACLERLRAALRRVEERRAGKVREGEAVGRGREEIARREGEVRRLLGEKGEEYERLRGEAGVGMGRGGEGAGLGMGVEG